MGCINSAISRVIKIEAPPQRGGVPECSFLADGISTHWSLSAIFLKNQQVAQCDGKNKKGQNVHNDLQVNYGVA